MVKARTQSAWAVLRLPGFRPVWFADFISNLGFFAQSVGAGWLMTSLTRDAHVIALVQTASALPLFLVAIPSGVLADLVDRRGLIRTMNAIMVLIAGVLAVLTMLDVITPVTLLVATFALGLADAIQEPAWGALIPEIVSESDLPSAIALNGINFNLSRVVSPPVAGLLVAVFGPAIAFAVNAASFVPTVFVMHPQDTTRRVTMIAFREGFEKTLGLVRTSVPVRDVLLRNAAFGTCSSVIFALLPLYVRVTLHANSTEFGLLFGAIGAGSVAVAQVLGQLRARFGVPNSILLGTIVLGCSIIALGCSNSMIVAYLALFVAGFGWLTVLSSLNTAIQFAVPPEHRASGFSLYLVTSQGISAFGSAAWGAFAASFGSNAAFICAGTLFVILGVATRRVPLPWKAG
jgi:MFS family permease